MKENSRKLRRDGIVEALLEVRFEATAVPELVVGRLAAGDAWRDFHPQRLPFADIPAPVRQMDPNLHFQPTLQLQSPDGSKAAKIGERVFSWHALRQYPGWERFQPELKNAIGYLFSSLQGAPVTRLGFRYLNLLNAKDHHIRTVDDLNLRIEVGGSSLQPPLNLNYRHARGGAHNVIVRVASPEFVSGPAQTFSALVDIDVSTTEQAQFNTATSAMEWVEKAHDLLKQEFFSLLDANTLEKIWEDT